MDPITAVGAAAGSLKVAEIAIRLTQIVTQTFRTWRNAPDELLALHNSIVFLGVLLGRVKETCLTIQESATDSKKPEINPEVQKALEHQLGLATACLERLTGLSERLSVGGKAVQRARWVRLRSTVVEETRRIREIHRDIDSVLTSYVAYVQVPLPSRPCGVADTLAQRLNGENAQRCVLGLGWSAELGEYESRGSTTFVCQYHGHRCRGRRETSADG